MDDEDAARFEKLWSRWDERVAAGTPPVELLREAKDEELIEILAGESRLDRKYARDIIATEMLNRLHARSASQHPGAKIVEDSAREAHRAAKDGQEAIHHAEGILKANGEVSLGSAVSRSADASLIATRAAFDSAKVQAAALHQTLAQSRLGEELAAEAVAVADEGRDVTRELESTMHALGRGDEGRAASEASRRIQEATGHAAKDAAVHDAGLRE